MLLQALYDFYERACSDPNTDIEEAAFTRKPVRWLIPLDSDGNLEGAGLISNDTKEGARRFKLPKTNRPKKGREAEFLCDGLDSLFKLHPSPDKPKDEAMLLAKHADFWGQIREAYVKTNLPSLHAVLRFKEKCLSPERPGFLTTKESMSKKGEKQTTWLVATAKGEKEKLGNDNFSFQVNGEILLDDGQLMQHWREAFAQERAAVEGTADKGLCLVTGNSDVAISASHLPKISGVRGATPTGAALISFDKASFRSYGFDKSYNAPVSLPAVEAYCNALNFVLLSDNHHLNVGSAALCFWSSESDEAPATVVNLFDKPTEQAIHNFLTRPWRGEADGARFDESEQFYSVTLSGNTGRIVVRHWMQTTVKQALDNFRNWFEDLNVVKFRPLFEIEAAPPLSIFRLAATTVRDEKDVRPELPSQLYRAALEGHTPSLTIAQQILRRLQTDLCKFGDDILETPLSAATERRIREASHPVPPPGESRMALLRLIINRNRKEGESMIEPAITETDNRAYNCGRLFAVLDDLQREALATKKQKDGKEYWQKFDGAGVIERFYGSASANPSIAFPYLLRLHQHHLKKLAQIERTWLQEKFKKKIEEISSAFTAREFPKTLNLLGQGRFALGFYQQKASDRAERQSYLDAKKNKPDASHDNIKGESTDE